MTSRNLSHLAVFAAVARSASFRKASDEVGLSTSAVSYAIQNLERQLGVTLFNRTTRSVSLTEAGARLLERLQPALHDIGDAMDEMNRFRSTPSGAVRLNVARLAAQLLVVPLAKEFLLRYPEIQLEVMEDDSYVDIVAAGFDAGIRHESIPEDMVAVNIDFPFRAACVASPSYLKKRGTPKKPQDLLDHDCIRYRFQSGRHFKWQFSDKGEAVEVDVHGPITLTDTFSVLRAAADGIGIGYLAAGNAAPLMQAGKLVEVLKGQCRTFPGFTLYYPQQRRVSSALRAFIDFIKARAPELSAMGD